MNIFFKIQRLLGAMAIGGLIFVGYILFTMPNSLWMPFYGDLPLWLQDRSLESVVVPLIPYVVMGACVVGLPIYFWREL